MDFNKTKGLKKDSDFRKVYKHGKSFANKHLVMYILENKSDCSRVGISVSKKVGKAITRNKVRRRIREAYRLNIDENVKNGYDIVFIARVASKDVEYKDIEKSINHLTKKASIKLK
ncbi:MAG: ribonuclease P protein component [Romboutsia sp.]|uniref:ribonuclease P protein component n=1 Tax=Romboutsia sp. TaxID=1965302 RepID=UPI003F2B069F